MGRLNRTRLLYGKDALAKIQNTTVMVVGCGAVGSFAIEALARTGVGHLILIDCDEVEESNINRQLFALDSTIGQDKVLVAKQRIFDINPDIKVEAIKTFFDSNTELLQTPDYVVDAIDTVDSKIALYQWCQERNIPFISSMGAALKTDISKIKIDRISKTTVCPLASKVRKLVKEKNIKDFEVVYSTEPSKKTIMPNRQMGSVINITGTFGLYIANWVIEKIVGEQGNV